MKIIALLITTTFLAAACNGTSDDDVDVDSRAVCDCPEKTAADIPYDNVGSGLVGADVQDAVDELAARPEGIADAFERIMIVEVTDTSPTTGTSHVVQVVCPGTGPDLALAIGGGCDGATSNAPITRMTPDPSPDGLARAFECVWAKPEGVAIEVTARAVCLGKAGVSYE